MSLAGKSEIRSNGGTIRYDDGKNPAGHTHSSLVQNDPNLKSILSLLFHFQVFAYWHEFGKCSFAILLLPRF